jgi:hypothetical protein
MWTCSHSETGAAAMEAHIDSDPNKNGGLVTHPPPGKNLRAVPTTFVAPTPPRLRAHYPCATPDAPISLATILRPALRNTRSKIDVIFINNQARAQYIRGDRYMKWTAMD